MYRFFRIVCYSLLLLIPLFSKAEPEKISFGNISLSERGAGTIVEQVIQDYKGFLWFATLNGLCRYSGSSIHFYDASIDTNSLPFKGIRCLYEDSLKRLWIGTENGLLVEYNRKLDNFTRHVIDTALQGTQIFKISQISRNKLLIASYKGLFVYEIDKNRFVQLIKNISVRDFMWKNQSILLLATEYHGVIEFDISHYKTIKSYSLLIPNYLAIENQIVFKFCRDKKGKIWAVTSYGGLFHFNEKDDKFTFLPVMLKGKRFTEELLFIFNDSDDNLLITGINSGLICYNIKTNTCWNYATNTSNQKGLTSNTITDIFRDNNGTLWLSTHRGGVHYYNKTFSTITQFFSGEDIASLSGNTVSSIIEGPDKTVIVGTDGGGINVLNCRTNLFSHFTSKDGLPNDAVTDITKDKSGHYWAAIWSYGVFGFDIVNGKVKPLNVYKNIPKIESVKGIFCDSKNRIWVASLKQGVCIISNQTSAKPLITSLPENEYLKKLQLIDFFEDSDHNIWVCTYHGIGKISPSNKIVVFKIPIVKGIAPQGDISMGVYESNNKTIWVLSSYGLMKYDKARKSFISCSEHYDLPFPIQGIVEGANGVLWLSSPKGIIAFNSRNNTFRFFDEGFDMHANSFMERAACKLQNGMICFGGINGLIGFNPNLMKQNMKAPIVEFTGLYINNIIQQPGTKNSIIGGNISELESIQIPYKYSVFTIEYDALNFISPQKNTYKYKLEGFDKDWVDAQNNRRATYTNLDPGKYVFTVIAANNSGIWNKKGKSIVIEILPPWWKTIWFRFGVFLFIITLFVVFYKLRIKSIERQNKILEQEVARRTHELSESNALLLESNEEITLQNEKLEALHQNAVRHTQKILLQQEEIIEQKNELEKNNKELKELNKTKDKLFSIIGHDLKNPINALLGFSNLLETNLNKQDENKDSNQEAKLFVNHIVHSSSAIKELLVNLLDWAKTESKSMRYSPSNVSMKHLVETNIHILKHQLKLKNQRLENRINDDVTVFVDVNMILTVIRNILSNAGKFTPRNGCITIDLRTEEHYAVIEIADTGIGMSAEQIALIFSNEHAPTTKGTEDESGTGLGLLICKEFIEINKGVFQIESENHEGTRCIVKLPLLNQNEENTPILKEEEIQIQSIRALKESDVVLDDFALLNDKRILLVDDNIHVRSALKYLLANVCEVIEAENGEKALQLAFENMPDLIISDVNMPVMDGIELCKHLKQHPDTCHIPFILLTAEDNENRHFSGLEAKANAYLNKPFNPKMLLILLSNMIENQKNIKQLFVNQLEINAEQITNNELDAILLDKLISFVDSHITDENLNSDVLAQAVSMSRSLLYIKLKNITGQSVNEFIRTVRLKKSAQLLLLNKHNVNEIADLCGFNSTSYYIRSFVKMYGVSPLDYLKKMRENV